ncbi:hypothetical protein EK21DRAFT_70481, partial [Setomelanomma holmii]
EGPHTLQYHLIQPRARSECRTLTSCFMGNSGQVLPCPLCPDRPFTGVWAHRNLSRHMENLHGVKHLPCGHEDCPRTFRREDARLVHERRSHPELNRPPPTRRKRSSDLGDVVH